MSVWQSETLQLESPLFNKLPAELRLLVYQYAFGGDFNGAHHGGEDPWQDWRRKKCVEILFTCKLFYLEAKDHLYNIQDFYWDIDSSDIIFQTAEDHPVLASKKFVT